ncbi:TldD/PmbA family protein [Candidatus Peregrinibacteria bacterium]|nr:TldD/PmbA family protein [Candidatus Peregrinibacteria bacterium]
MNEKIREVMEYVVHAGKSKGLEFCDVRVCKSVSTAIKIQDGVAREIAAGDDYGAAIRVFKNGAWGFASTNTIDKANLLKALSEAIPLTKRNHSRKLRLPHIRPTFGKAESTFKIAPSSVSESEKLKVLSILGKEARLYSKKIINTILAYADTSTTECVANSAGSYTQQTLTRIRLMCSVIASDGRRKQSMRKSIGKLGGFELVKELNPENFSIAAAKSALRLLDAKDAPSGEFTVITDPDISGLFAHEACGHNSEGDLVAYNQSILAGSVGKKIASPAVTLIDDATLPNKHGSYFFDSEGTPGQRRNLIEKGKVQGFMHSLETASLLKAEPNGSARAQLHQNMPIVRMSNTFFAPGNVQLDDLISGVKFGILAKGFNWGYVEVGRGQFTCNVQEAYAIRNGVIAEPYGNISIGGLTLETLKNVEDCSKEWAVDTPGMCGKGGQWMWVATGGPYMKIRKMVVGGFK